jgi:phage minor structural protein
VDAVSLILHPDTATTFRNNGIGVLSDAITSKVVRELNGQYELMLKYPDTGTYAKFIADRFIIMAKPDPVTDPQPFRIYRVNPVSKGTITAYARHIAYDTMGIPCAPFTAASCADAVRNLSVNAATDCPFSFSTDKTVAGSLTVDVPKSIWGIMGGSAGSILDRYGGEYDFDGYNIALQTRLGADRGVSIRYGKNLSTLEQDRNCANVYTGVFPYWKPYEGDVVMLPEQIIHAAGTYNFTRILPLDLSQKFDAAPTEEQLREAAENYMVNNNIGVPDISWTVQFVQLEQTEEYKGAALLERVLLGDTVSVVFPRMNVNASARAVKIDFDPILERYNSVTLGRVKSDLATTIVKQQQEISKRPSAQDMTSIINDKLSVTIPGINGGAVRLLDTNGDGNPDELYIADHEDPSQAAKVWRFNYEGWAASKTGYNGPYIFGATLEDGLLANFVTAAQLVAGTIRSRDGETFFLDLDNGVLKMKAIGEVEDSLSDLGDRITEQSAEFDVMSEQISMRFETIEQGAQGSDNGLQEQFNKLYKYIKFSGETGITIGSGDSALTLELDNETGIVFKKNGVQFGLWDGENFHTGNIIIGVNERAQFGSFAFVPRSDGSLSFLKVGG